MSSQLSSAWLRSIAAKTEAMIHLTPEQATYFADEMDRSHRLALEQARTDIETMCPEVMQDGTEPKSSDDLCHSWYNTARIDPENSALLAESITYLERHGNLLRCSSSVHLVRYANTARKLT